MEMFHWAWLEPRVHRCEHGISRLTVCLGSWDAMRTMSWVWKDHSKFTSTNLRNSIWSPFANLSCEPSGTLCLDSDPSLIPLSCKVEKTTSPNNVAPFPASDTSANETDDHDEQNSKPNESTAIKQIFDVEYCRRCKFDGSCQEFETSIRCQLSSGPGAWYPVFFPN